MSTSCVLQLTGQLAVRYESMPFFKPSRVVPMFRTVPMSAARLPTRGGSAPYGGFAPLRCSQHRCHTLPHSYCFSPTRGRSCRNGTSRRRPPWRTVVRPRVVGFLRKVRRCYSIARELNRPTAGAIPSNIAAATASVLRFILMLLERLRGPPERLLLWMSLPTLTLTGFRRGLQLSSSPEERVHENAASSVSESSCQRSRVVCRALRRFKSPGSENTASLCQASPPFSAPSSKMPTHRRLQRYEKKSDQPWKSVRECRPPAQR